MWMFRILFFTITVIIKIDITNATTPPSFEGIDRRITYANRKYHSGWMCSGATMGFAILKFSTSLRAFGAVDTRIIINQEIRIIGMESFIVNILWNLILSVFVFVFVGFEEPFSCRSIRWITIIARITIGSKKCSEKKRLSVGWETDGPPQIHSTSSLPTIGIAERTPVITVAPQNDIWPHGSTYPKNAVAIVIIIRMAPDNHTFILFLGEEK